MYGCKRCGGDTQGFACSLVVWIVAVFVSSFYNGRTMIVSIWLLL